MLVLVCGGRDYLNRRAVFDSLTMLAGYAHRVCGKLDGLAHGGATGADLLVGEWGRLNRVGVSVFKADWDVYGRAAGPVRNQRMLREFCPDVVLAFPGGAGTRDMVNKAEAAGVTVLYGPLQGNWWSRLDDKKAPQVQG